MKSNISHKIKHREEPNDEFITPIDLARSLVRLIPVKNKQKILSAAYGTGNFYRVFPSDTKNLFTKDFFKWKEMVSWIIDNPPYSCLDEWLEHSADVCEEGFAYLLGLHNITPKRIEFLEKKGFYITKIHLCKVFKWFGISAFIVWEKNASDRKIVDYDRIVWR